MYKIIRINKNIDRKTFDCGNESLNQYLLKHARQNDKNDISRCYVAMCDKKPVGYYAFCYAKSSKNSLRPEDSRGLPGYPVGAVRVGRLANDLSVRGKGVGSMLLKDCLRRIAYAASGEGPAFKFVIVDAKDQNAISFYQKYGFLPYRDNPFALFMPVATILKSMQTDI